MRRRLTVLVVPLLAVLATLTSGLVLARPADAAPPADAAVDGTVTLSDGTPAVGAQVRVEPHPYDPAGTTVLTLTGDDGSYLASPLAAGTYDVTAQKGPGLPVTRTVTLAAGTRITVDVVLPAPASVTGRVAGPGGVPLAGVCVTATSADGVRDACSGADGAYTLTDLRPGSYTLTATDPAGRYAPASRPALTLAAGQALPGQDFALVAAGVVAGTVVDRSTGEPLAGVCPTTFAERTTSYVRATENCSDATGAWSVTGLAAGRYTVLLSPSDGVHQQVWAVRGETQADATLLRVRAGVTGRGGEVRLPRGGTVTGRVTDRSGRPIANATVNLGAYSNFLGDGGASATTDADGRYTIRNVDAGRQVVLTSTYGQPYAWLFSGNAADPARARPVTVVYGRTTHYDAVLGPEAPLTVTITNAAQPDQDYLVDVFTPRGDAVGFHTGTAGTTTARVQGLPPGTYRVRITRPGGSVVWSGGGTTLATAADVRVPPSGASVTVDVR